MNRTLCFGTIALVVVLVSAVSQAAWVKVDDFEREDSGSLGNGWTDPGDALSIKDGQMRVDGGSANQYAYKALGNSIADGQVGTFFFQVTVATDVSGGNLDETVGFGLSDSSDPTSSGDYNVYGPITDDDPDIVAGSLLMPEDGGTVAALDNGVMYNVWIVVDNDQDRADWYLTTGTDAATTMAPFNADHDIHESPAGDLQAVAIASFSSNDAGTVVYFDNMYVDATGENLSLVPEPTTVGLLALGSLAALRRRR